jgi:OmpA-OmpF porin, OOP family
LRNRAAALAAALIVAGCATPEAAPPRPALFAVLPASDGHVGAIVVNSGGESRVVDRAYGAQRLLPDGSVRAEQLTQAQVQAAFGEALAALPGRPISFTLYFLEGRDELTQQSSSELEKMFDELRRRPLPDVMVIGHTDTVGSLGYNDRLSLARAQRLRDILISLGIPAERIQAAGRGERELLVPTEENVPEPRNRRVEISVR